MKRADLMPAPIRLPDVTDEQNALVDELKARAEHITRQQVGLVAAMLRLRKPLARRGHPKRKQRKTTKHVRHMRRQDAKASYVAATRAIESGVFEGIEEVA